MPSLARLISSIALALTFAGQLSVLVHMGAVPHERCAEHGELIEGAGAAPRAAHGAVDDADRLTAVAGVDDDVHDHCPLGTREMDAAHPPPMQAVAPVPTAIEVLHKDPPASFVVARTYLVAPKQSPPLG